MDLAKTMEGWFKQLPSLPPSAVNVLVQIAPWLALIFGVLGVLATVSALGILSIATPFAVAAGATGFGLGFIVVLLGLGASVLELAAFPGLKAQKLNGWNLLFWSQVVSVVSSLVSIVSGGYGGVVGAVLGALIGFYLLFQIKPKYK